MAEGLAEAVANAILTALCKSTPWTEPAALWVKLHVGAPGAAGTSNPAVETDRIQATFATDADDGLIANTAALTYPGVGGTEDYTHWTAWDASTSGAFQFSGVVTANAVVIGDDFVIGIGGLTVSLGIAS